MTLKLSEIREYHKIWKNAGGDNRYSEWFGGKHRVYLDVIDKAVEITPISEIQKVVSTILLKDGYSIKDYKEGTATKEDNKNEFKIGRILQKVDTELKNKFDSDLTREGAKLKKSGLKAVISKHPLDIALMSTGRGWTSCMDIRNGHNSRFINEDIKEGTLVAYLIKEDDVNIKHPIARVLIKPFVNDTDTVLVVDARVYGLYKAEFLDAINKWLDINQPKKLFGVFRLTKNLYNDGKHSIMVGYDAKYQIVSFQGDYIIIYDTQKSRYGIITKTGDIVLQTEYYSISIDNINGTKNLFKVTTQDDGKLLSGYVSIEDGVTKRTKLFNYVNRIAENILHVGDGKFYGLITFDGDEILECKYTNINLFGNNNYCTIIQTSGNVVTKSVYDISNRKKLFDIGVYDSLNVINNLFIVNNKKIYDINGNLIIDCQNIKSLTNNRHLSLTINYNDYIYDAEEMKYVSEQPYSYKSINRYDLYCDGVYIPTFTAIKTLENGKQINVFIDTNGVEYFAEYEITNWNFNGTRFFTSKVNNYFELFDLISKKRIVSSEKEYDTILVDNYYGSTYGYNPFGNHHAHIINSSNDYIIVQNNKLSGVIKVDGTEIIPTIYEDVRFNDGIISLKCEGRWKYFTIDGGVTIKTYDSSYIQNVFYKMKNKLNKIKTKIIG